MKTSPALQKPKPKQSQKPTTAKTASTAKSPLGKPAASPARPTHTSTRKSVKPATKTSAKPSARVNNLPAVSRVGLRFRLLGRDAVVLKIGTRDRVTCLGASGSKLLSVRLKWGALRKNKNARIG